MSPWLDSSLMAVFFSAKSRDHFARSFNSKKIFLSDNWLTRLLLHRVVFMEDGIDSSQTAAAQGCCPNASAVKIIFSTGRACKCDTPFQSSLHIQGKA